VPRLLVLFVGVVLSLLGLRSLMQGAPPQASALQTTAAPDQDAPAAQALAERFVRAYLAWNPRRPAARERALAALVGADVGPDAGLTPAAGSPVQRVEWTQVVGDEAGAGGVRTVVVRAQTTRGVFHVAVPVRMGPEHALSIAGLPALVGPPPLDTDRPLPDELPVEDPGLAEVARRAIANYLTGDRANLVADLAPGARVVMPRPLAEVTVGRASWADRSRDLVAVAVEATLPGGARAALRYEISVVDDGRWLMRGVEGG